jgi:hypothetical protein
LTFPNDVPRPNDTLPRATRSAIDDAALNLHVCACVRACVCVCARARVCVCVCRVRAIKQERRNAQSRNDTFSIKANAAVSLKSLMSSPTHPASRSATDVLRDTGIERFMSAESSSASL